MDKRVETLAWAAKASVTGYSIRFKTLKDIKLDILDGAMHYGIKHIDND
ncbi:hypothetical protein J0A68_15790 [Algoriphagus sp. H41]|uniref:Uncharacterized protein n=1 Tax=Algoriphagus oliviformis TaxID=2811231 RepID=A0ABS3C6E1_9BACT|nr:hypothetical protein [Algoriphagus oliviformis]MBN7812415.1 hypothetical protein [Algoriphagus oliviformis]